MIHCLACIQRQLYLLAARKSESDISLTDCNGYDRWVGVHLCLVPRAAMEFKYPYSIVFLDYFVMIWGDRYCIWRSTLPSR